MLTDESIPDERNEMQENPGEYCPKGGIRVAPRVPIACGECSVCIVAKVMGTRLRWQLCLIANPVS